MKIKHITVYLDGGTIAVVFDNGENYYVDNRLGSRTSGTVYTSYPPQGDVVTGPLLAEIVAAVRELDESVPHNLLYKKEVFRLMGTA
jgi:hypothetical protein